jgi:hypothetical protein
MEDRSNLSTSNPTTITQLNQSPQPQPTQQTNLSQKKSPLIPLLIFIIVLLLGTLGFLAYKFILTPQIALAPETQIIPLPSSIPTTSPESSPSLTAEKTDSLQTHQGSIYQVQYPEEAETQQYDNTFSIYYWGPTQKEETELYDGYSVNISTTEMGMSFSDYVAAKINETNNNGISTVIDGPSPITINNLTGQTYQVEGMGTWQEIIIPDVEEVLALEISVHVKDPGNLDFQQTVNNIFDSITFIDNL